MALLDQLAKARIPLNSLFESKGSDEQFGLGDLLVSLTTLIASDASWGNITGTLSNQTDLQSALNAKLSLSGGTMSGDINGGTHNITNVGSFLGGLVGKDGNTCIDFTGTPGKTAHYFGGNLIFSIDGNGLSVNSGRNTYYGAALLANTDGTTDIGSADGGVTLLRPRDYYGSRNIRIGGNLGVGNSASATTPGTVVKKIEIFNATGTSLGFIPVYDTIT